MPTLKMPDLSFLKPYVNRLTQRQYMYIALACWLLSLAFFTAEWTLPSYVQRRVEAGLSRTLDIQPSRSQHTSAVSLSASEEDDDDDLIPALKRWSNSSVGNQHSYISVYLHNVTNPSEVLQYSQPAQLATLGPYIFEMKVQRLNVTFADDVYTGEPLVEYYEHKSYHYDEELTALHSTSDIPLNLTTDLYTIPNFYLQGVYQNLPDSLQGMYGSYTESERLFTQRTPMELLFGYADDISSLNLFPGILPNVTSAAAATKKGRNAMNVKTRSIVQWHNQRYLSHPAAFLSKKQVPVWQSIEANHIHGTDGLQFTRPIQRNQSLVTYVPELYRSLVLRPTNHSAVQRFGIPLHRYSMETSQWANASVNSVNADYYMYAGNGLFNLSVMYNNVGVYVSNPYCIGCDARTRNAVVYQNYNTTNATSPAKRKRDPNDERHNPELRYATYLDVEPHTGLTMNAYKRYQINLRLTSMQVPINDTHVTWFPTLGEQGLYMPVCWLEEHGSIAESDAKVFKKQVLHNLQLVNHAAVAFYTLGMLLAGISLITFMLALHVDNTKQGQLQSVGSSSSTSNSLLQPLLGSSTQADDEEKDDRR